MFRFTSTLKMLIFPKVFTNEIKFSSDNLIDYK